MLGSGEELAELFSGPDRDRGSFPDAGPKTPLAYEAKLKALADTIADLSPDVLAVQEVGDPEALTDLAKQLAGQGYDHVRTADPDGRGIRVGFMSRLPLLDVHQAARFQAPLRPIQVDDTTASEGAMGRPALVAGIVTRDGTRIDLVTCHLKSKLLTFPGGAFSTRDEGLRARYGAYALYRRAAEAASIREAATSLLAGKGKERAVIVLGDLNDEPAAATTQIVYGPPGSEIGTAGYDQADGGDGARLWNLAPRIPEDQRYSRIYRGQRELIDHMLVSHLVSHHVTDGDVTVGPRPDSIDDNPNDRRDKAGSDHRPIVATIAL